LKKQKRTFSFSAGMTRMIGGFDANFLYSEIDQTYRD